MKKIFFMMIIFWSSYWAMAQVATYDNVAKLYVATFNRAPDADGLEYWVYKSNLSLEGIAKSFFEQPETEALYPSNYSNSKFIDAIYENVFGRTPDKAGKNYWLEDLNTHYIDRGTFILAVVNGALGDDAVLLANKTEVALEFAQRGLNDYKLAKEVMKYVTANPSSVKEAINILNKNKNIKDDENYKNDRIKNSNISHKKHIMPHKKRDNDMNSNINKNDDIHNNINDDINNKTSYISKKIGWYIRLIAEARLNNGKRFIQNKEGVFGEYKYSIDGEDRHDIPSFGTDILRVVFIHNDWNGASQYYSDYRKYSEDSSTKEVWTFQVKNDRDINLANASLKLYFEGLYDIFDNRGDIIERVSKNQNIKKSLKIIDLDNGNLYLYGDSKAINISMDGKHTRTFRIVLGDVTDDDYKAINSINDRSLFRVNKKVLHRRFGLPPSL